MNEKLNKYKYIALIFEVAAGVLLAYLIFLPLFPEIKYRLAKSGQFKFAEPIDAKEIAKITEESVVGLAEAEFAVSPNRLIINKIGVNIPLIVSNNSDYALSKGAWLDPEGSRPDKGGNTVISGHRFKYLPPSNFTFYLFHKLEIGDMISALWDEQYYFYKIEEIKIVDPVDLSILNPTAEPTITLYTCDPIYSQKKRLVVVAKILDVENLINEEK